MRMRFVNNQIKARILRANLTKEERILWSKIRNRYIFKVKFRRQEPIGPYIADFVSIEKKIIIELDGGQHNEEDTKSYDIERTKYLNECGFKVLRFWNNEITHNLNGVLESIMNEIHSSPSP